MHAWLHQWIVLHDVAYIYIYHLVEDLGEEKRISAALDIVMTTVYIQ